VKLDEGISMSVGYLSDIFDHADGVDVARDDAAHFDPMSVGSLFSGWT
jgi:hypothetical protein